MKVYGFYYTIIGRSEFLISLHRNIDNANIDMEKHKFTARVLWDTTASEEAKNNFKWDQDERWSVREIELLD